MNLDQQVHGEVISFARGFALRAAASCFFGFVLVATGAFVLLLAYLNSEVGRRSDTLVIGMPGLGFIAAAVFSFWKCWDLLTRKPRLLLGRERMSWVERGGVYWEVGYERVAAIELFQGPLSVQAIGIRLRAPEISDEKDARLPWRWRSWQTRWKRFGFDIVLPPRPCTEPPDRVLETALTCLHRYRRVKDPAGRKLDS